VYRGLRKLSLASLGVCSDVDMHGSTIYAMYQLRYPSYLLSITGVQSIDTLGSLRLFLAFGIRLVDIFELPGVECKRHWTLPQSKVLEPSPSSDQFYIRTSFVRLTFIIAPKTPSVTRATIKHLMILWFLDIPFILSW